VCAERCSSGRGISFRSVELIGRRIRLCHAYVGLVPAGRNGQDDGGKETER
jgi:hypothetical protein